MRRVVALLLAVVGLWFLVPGILSICGAPSTMSPSPVPAMTTGTLLGAGMLGGAVLLWRRGAG